MYTSLGGAAEAAVEASCGATEGVERLGENGLTQAGMDLMLLDCGMEIISFAAGAKLKHGLWCPVNLQFVSFHYSRCCVVILRQQQPYKCCPSVFGSSKPLQPVLGPPRTLWWSAAGLWAWSWLRSWLGRSCSSLTLCGARCSEGPGGRCCLCPCSLLARPQQRGQRGRRGGQQGAAVRVVVGASSGALAAAAGAAAAGPSRQGRRTTGS
jgi:hypothetical protein